MLVIHERIIKLSLIFFIFNIFTFNASAEISTKLKFPLNKSKNYEYMSVPVAYCSNQPSESDTTVCFTDIEDYKSLCKKTNSVTNFSVKMNAVIKPGGDILFDNGGFKSVKISWNDASKKCVTVMQFSGMVRGTDMNFQVKGYIKEFAFTKDNGKLYGQSYPEFQQD